MMPERNKIGMSEAAKEARRVYERAYYAKNRERILQQRAKHWERVAERNAAAQAPRDA